MRRCGQRRTGVVRIASSAQARRQLSKKRLPAGAAASPDSVVRLAVPPRAQDACMRRESLATVSALLTLLEPICPRRAYVARRDARPMRRCSACEGCACYPSIQRMCKVPTEGRVFAQWSRCLSPPPMGLIEIYRVYTLWVKAFNDSALMKHPMDEVHRLVCLPLTPLNQRHDHTAS